MDACLSLYSETEGLGFAEDDMIAVIHAIEARTQRAPAGTGIPSHDA